MSILVAIILGGLVGYVAARLLGRNEGVLASIIIGIIGSFIGSFVSRLFTGGDQSLLAFSVSGLFWSLIGSLVLVAILNALRKPRRNVI
ncbi:GlsB/YeaQ/YmgE family stress response membrane protein [Polaromonas sp.]|nr:GlsB/YeaQ/YmgE family stress response membrane protein [Candidatus Saccharibacteria bacterium]